jgi:mono/diheme cytochrome c family protein
MSSHIPIIDRPGFERRLAIVLLGAVFGVAALGAQNSIAASPPASSAPANSAPAKGAANAAAASAAVANPAQESSNIPFDTPTTKLFPGSSSPPPQIADAKKYEGNPTYISAGRAIFEHYNCSGCHFHGAGGMGPPFINGGHWIYGGKLDQIFASIYQGRPNGMPSWGRTIPVQEIWEIASYVKALSAPTLEGPTLPPLPKPKPEVPGGNAKNGMALIESHGCGSCHEIPGIKDANGTVGPPLNNIAQRAVIAGVMPNSMPNMIAWIENPQAIVPGNAMPNLGLNDNDARDIATYLSTLH